MKDILVKTFAWIKEDWESDKFRFIIEFIGWVISIVSALVMAITAPNPPLLWMYPVWMIGVILYGWAAWSRKSFSMLANAILLTIIDIYGYYNVLTA